LEKVYGRKLETVPAKKKLLANLGMAVSDVICKVERRKNSNLDVNLKIIQLNHKVIEDILRTNKIQKIYFSSRFVEDTYRKRFKFLIAEFPTIRLLTLPSPSPRYAVLSIKQKMVKYRKLMPRLETSG